LSIYNSLGENIYLNITLQYFAVSKIAGPAVQ